MIDFVKEVSNGIMHKPSVVNATDGSIWLYGIQSDSQKNKKSLTQKGSYTNIAYVDKRPNMTTQTVRNVITKSIPSYGPYGSFSLLSRDSNKLVFPLNLKELNLALPNIVVSSDDGTTLKIACSAIGYEAYRVDLIKGNDLFENVFYATDGNIDITIASPLQVPYTLFIQAYAEEVSIYSPVYEIEITGDPAGITQEWLWNNLVDSVETANRFGATEGATAPVATYIGEPSLVSVSDMKFVSAYDLQSSALSLGGSQYYAGTSSYVFWFRTTDASNSTRGLIASTESSMYLPSVAITGFDAKLNLIVQSGDSTHYSLSDKSYADGQWHMVVLRHDADRNIASISIDNGADTVASNYTGTQPTQPGPLTLGRLGSLASGYFAGSIGPLRTYDRLITPSEEFWLWNGGKGR